MEQLKTKGSTERVKVLLETLKKRGFSDRSGEWFEKETLENIAVDENFIRIPIIERKAKAFKVMLEAMTNDKKYAHTRTYEIKPSELIVGVIPMGSLGFGKIFPNYLTDLEKDVAFFSNRDVVSVLGHNSPDYNRVLSVGLKGIISECVKRREIIKKERELREITQRERKSIWFFNAVEICCNAVVDYTRKFAALAEREAKKTDDETRKQELLEIARICRKVPYEPAETFHEALQSIYFVHLVFHSTGSHLSLGRLDQVLQPFLEKSLNAGETDLPKAQELVECFLIKCAERLTLTMNYIEKQDHCDFATGMGNNPFLVDQEASINQFMQNIVLGGQTHKGEDATNQCTYLFLNACAGVGLPTPVINVRFHKNSPEKLYYEVSRCSLNANNGQPVIYNDEVIVPGLNSENKIPLYEARDYVIDGCWEVLLNGKCDFTYNMVNLLPVLECTLNGGALMSGGTAQLRGRKMSLLTPLADKIETFDKLKEIFAKHLQLFTNKAGLQIYSFYCLEGSVTPVPFFSSMLGNCLERGLDKTWAGANYNIGGIVFIALPNVANSLVSIKKYVFDTRKYALEEVVKALKSDYNGKPEWQQMKKDFIQAPKFGNNDPEVNEVMKWLTETIHNSLKKAQDLSNYVYLDIPKKRDKEKVIKLRAMAEYEGPAMKERFGHNFNIVFTAGSGTFELYAHFGIGCAASADGRGKDQPVAPNCSPYSGTAVNGEGAILESLKDLGLNRFGTGVMTDICLEKNETTQEKLIEVYKKFIRSNGSILSLTIVGSEIIKEVYKLCNEVRAGLKPVEVLDEYADINVRVGGWNGPFITLSKVHQEDYIKRVIH